jgi:methionine-gamma-lyase
MKKPVGFGSLCVHETKDTRSNKPHTLPIYATTVFEFESVQQGMDIFQGKAEGHIYSRFGNPTIDAVAEKIALLEAHGLQMEAEGLLVSSGMAAIATLMLGVLKPGDKILTQGNLYGGTTELFARVLQPLGFDLVYTDLKDLDQIEKLLASTPAIRMVYFETPANPTLACVDMEAIAGLARKYERFTAVDNTFCTPYLQQPLRFGIDFVVHSTTKYLNGHGNSTAGAIVGRDKGLMKDKVWRTMKLVGTNCNPFDAWLINNGLKTLELRMERHCDNAMRAAQFLEKHRKVAQVNYVGLPSHPDHALAARQMRSFSGMLSFELSGGLEAGIDFINRLKFCVLAPTMGDVDTLAMHPASMSHASVPREIRLLNGITDGLVRLSVGIENIEDILTDLDQALHP